MALLLLPCHKSTSTSTSTSTFPPVAHTRQPNHHRFLFSPPPPPRPLLLFFQSNHQTRTSPFAAAAGSGRGGGRNNGRGSGGGWWGREDWWWDGGGDDGNNDDNNSNSNKVAVVSVLSLLCCFRLSSLALAGTAPPGPEEKSDLSAWEVKGGKWTKLVPGDDDDVAFLTDGGMLVSHFVLPFSRCGLGKWFRHCQDVFVSLMLPEGYPKSVTSDYLEYSLWRAVQGIASQISGVLSTQVVVRKLEQGELSLAVLSIHRGGAALLHRKLASVLAITFFSTGLSGYKVPMRLRFLKQLALLYAVGLGKGAIPTAAAISWVLKDGIGYISKIMLSKYGRHFDVHPKGWRLFADLLENAAFGLEILTPAFPHLFVLIGAAAGAGRSAATLIQAATRSCFFAGFAAQRNFAEVIAKGEAQGMVSKFVGIALGIALANYIGTSTPSALAAFGIVTGFHMYCNLKSYQSIQLRTLNPYRASLVFSEYLLSGEVPSVKEVNNEEPLFPVLPLVDVFFSSSASELEGSETLSPASKYAASQISQRLQLGCRLSEIVSFKADALALFDLFKDEGYMLAEKQGRFCVILKDGSSPDDMLKAVFHVNYLYWLEANVAWLKPRSIYDECRPGGRLHISLDYVRREFSHVKGDGQQAGWITGGLIARPSPYRIRPGYD